MSILEKKGIFLMMEIPLNKKVAKRRAIDPSLSRLIVGPRKQDKEGPRLITQILRSLRPPDKTIFIRAVGEFIEPKNISLPEDKRVTFLSDLQVLRIEDPDVLSEVLSLWKAEAHVIFFGDNKTAQLIISSLSQFHEKWWKIAKGGYEHPYLQQIGLCEPFLFFSESHMSLEIIGSEHTILSCFDSLLSGTWVKKEGSALNR